MIVRFVAAINVLPNLGKITKSQRFFPFATPRFVNVSLCS